MTKTLAIITIAIASITACSPDRSELAAVPTTTYTVAPSDTLWDIAAGCPDDVAGRSTWQIYLAEVNGITDQRGLRVGDQISVCA